MSGHDLDLQSVGQTNNNHSHLLIKSHSHLDGWIFALGHVFRLELSIEARHFGVRVRNEAHLVCPIGLAATRPGWRQCAGNDAAPGLGFLAVMAT
ncbi:hypothetical protein JH271_04175 [Xanthomonas campestris pv. campestris]|uniref:hypothetical protein n=1 Tax=Xanthomonas TaxID=338 RepID=UPI0013C34776|nr:hypothetical protein [Xanthomonas campestris]MCC5042498.1 hypothetical protein [Xanthomonas campestris]MCC5046088.1 hypothetical protein [Xanthomonas campestris]MCC5052276.1 hypothetical protein [Xanthomonas campestris pv. aberrans]MCC5058304.1 hypothetical protein [Xanthomonas campestris]MCF8868465.1 hypothetical protein [Xanthomonas campestris pv. campestris]